MIDATTVKSTGSIGGYMKIYDKFIGKIMKYMIIWFMLTLVGILVDRHEAAFRKEVKSFLDHNIKCLKRHLNTYD